VIPLPAILLGSDQDPAVVYLVVLFVGAVLILADLWRRRR
jgi:hypothetical protein